MKNTAVWIIDNLAIRAGNEKDTTEEADTVGCCSLRIEHITLAEVLFPSADMACIYGKYMYVRYGTYIYVERICHIRSTPTGAPRS